MGGPPPEHPPLTLLPQSRFRGEHWRILRGYFADRELARWNGASAMWLPVFLLRPMVRERPSVNRAFGILRGGEMVGAAELYDLRPAPVPTEGTLGIMLGPAHWGKGYGRAAVRLLLEFAFLGRESDLEPPLERVTLGTFAHNLRAQKAFAAAGFREVSRGRLRGFDSVNMEITREAFVALRAADPNPS